MHSLNKPVIYITKHTIPLLNSCYIINLVGNLAATTKATSEISEIADKYNLTAKSVNIHPNQLIYNSTQNIYTFNENIKKQLANAKENVLINNINKQTTCDEMENLMHYFRNDTHFFRHPWAFLIDEHATSHQFATIKVNCDAFNQIYPLKASFDTKLKTIGIYLDHTSYY